MVLVGNLRISPKFYERNARACARKTNFSFFPLFHPFSGAEASVGLRLIPGGFPLFFSCFSVFSRKNTKTSFFRLKEKGKSVILRKRIRYRTVIRTACDNTAENRFPGKKTPRETPARRKTKMNTKESAVAAQEKLSPYGAKLVYYGEIPLVGIENADPGKTAVLTFYEKEIVFEFSFHTAHFLPEDLPLALDTAEKFLMGEMSAVEFFLNGKSLFGGARSSSISGLNDIFAFCSAYAGGNGETAEKVLKLLRRGYISVKIRGISPSLDRDYDPPFGETFFLPEKADNMKDRYDGE